MGRVPLGLLQHFVFVARLGNLSRAASQSNLTVSALSHQIRNMRTAYNERCSSAAHAG
jgi:LysR family glycine cleavage system transcriptional activator